MYPSAGIPKTKEGWEAEPRGLPLQQFLVQILRPEDVQACSSLDMVGPWLVSPSFPASSPQLQRPRLNSFLPSMSQ